MIENLGLMIAGVIGIVMMIWTMYYWENKLKEEKEDA